MKKLLLTAALAVIGTMGANAQIFTETFTYPDGLLVGAVGSPWTNNSGTPGQQNVVSGEVFLDDNESEDTRASFSTSVTSDSVSASFQLRIDPLDVSTSATGAYFAHFIGDTDALGTTTDFIGRVYTRTPTVAGVGAFTLGVANSNNTPVFFATDFVAGTNYNVTLTYNFATATSTLTVAGVGSVVATDISVLITRIDSIGLRQATVTGDVFIDNLSVTAVPEPSTYALIGMGMLGLVVLRRMKSTSKA